MNWNICSQCCEVPWGLFLDFHFFLPRVYVWCRLVCFIGLYWLYLGSRTGRHPSQPGSLLTSTLHGCWLYKHTLPLHREYYSTQAYTLFTSLTFLKLQFTCRPRVRPMGSTKFNVCSRLLGICFINNTVKSFIKLGNLFLEWTVFPLKTGIWQHLHPLQAANCCRNSRLVT